MTEELYKSYILWSEADSEPITLHNQDPSNPNEDCPYIKLLVPTEMTSLLRIPVLYYLCCYAHYKDRRPEDYTAVH